MNVQRYFICCRLARSQNLLSFCKKGDDDSFTTKGFDNLKKAVEKFRLLENSDTHLEARLKCNLRGGSSVSQQLRNLAA